VSHRVVVDAFMMSGPARNPGFRIPPAPPGRHRATASSRPSATRARTYRGDICGSLCLPRQAPACPGKPLAWARVWATAWASCLPGQGRGTSSVRGKQTRSGEVRLGFCHTLPGQACDTTCLGKPGQGFACPGKLARQLASACPGKQRLPHTVDAFSRFKVEHLKEPAGSAVRGTEGRTSVHSRIMRLAWNSARVAAFTVLF
jgi:hypothetical protein